MSPSHPFVLDEKGREILPGDTLKVFHFTGARREKFYMYKFVREIVTLGTQNPMPALKIEHLGISKSSSGHYWELQNGRKLAGVEIVQGYGMDGLCHRDRPKYEPTNTAGPAHWVMSGQPV